MNVDFQIPMTSALARKLVQLRSMMNLDIDERIFQYANKDLLTREDIQTRVTPGMVNQVTEELVDLVQHAEDHHYRFAFGSRTFEDASICAMVSAFNSDKKIFVFDIDGADRRKNGTKSGWGAMFHLMGIKYQHVMTSDDTIDHEQRVLLINPKAISHEVLNNTRERVLVWLPEKDCLGTHSHHFSIGDLFNSNSATGHVTIDGMAREFPHTIIGFHLPEKDRLDKPTQWWRSQPVQNLIDGLFEDLKCKHLFAKGAAEQGQQAQNNLLNMGFILSSPKHMARLLGVYVALLDSKER